MRDIDSDSAAPREVNLAEYVTILWRARWSLLIVTLVAALIAFTAALLRPRMFTATATASVATFNVDPAAAIGTARVLMTSGPVATAIAKDLNLDHVPTIGVDNPTATTLLRIQVQLGDPDRAAAAANRVVTEAAALARRQANQSTETALKELEGELARARSRRDELAANLAQQERQWRPGPVRSGWTGAAQGRSLLPMPKPNAAATETRDIDDTPINVLNAESDLAVAVDIYKEILLQAEKYRLGLAVRPVQISLVTPATVTAVPRAPRVLLITIIAALFGCAVSAAAAFLRAYLPRVLSA